MASSTLTNRIQAVSHGDKQQWIKLWLKRQEVDGQVWTQDTHNNQEKSKVHQLASFELGYLGECGRHTVTHWPRQQTVG